MDVDKLLELIEKILNERKVLVERVFSYQDAGKIQSIRKFGQLLEEEYQQDGIFVRAYVPKDIYQSL
jgi:GTP-binding protein HflX